jgi:hypothetical protein
VQFKALDRGEVVAIIGGIVLAISLLLSWYSLGNQHAAVGNCHGPHSSCTGWHGLPLVVRVLLLLASAAPLILAYIIIRGHALSWPRGELTAVTSLAALTLTIFLGLIDKPSAQGAPPGQVSIDYGWFVALVGGLLILLGAVTRSRESAGRRKPPGVL